MVALFASPQTWPCFWIKINGIFFFFTKFSIYKKFENREPVNFHDEFYKFIIWGKPLKLLKSLKFGFKRMVTVHTALSDCIMDTPPLFLHLRKLWSEFCMNWDSTFFTWSYLGRYLLFTVLYGKTVVLCIAYWNELSAHLLRIPENLLLHFWNLWDKFLTLKQW